LGQRSRRRERTGDRPAPTSTSAAKPAGTEAAPRERAGEGSSPASPSPRDRTAERYARGRAKDAAVRAQLEPLAEGERPGAVTVAAVVALVLALANVGAYAAGARVRGDSNSIVGILVFAALMLTAAWGMWRAKYWAVLGFQALLGVTIGIAALSLAVASNVEALVLCLAIIAGAGFLFYKLVRAMARIQMPERRPPDHVG
jgi:hypothetical protein